MQLLPGGQCVCAHVCVCGVCVKGVCVFVDKGGRGREEGRERGGERERFF